MWSNQKKNRIKLWITDLKKPKFVDKQKKDSSYRRGTGDEEFIK